MGGAAIIEINITNGQGRRITLEGWFVPGQYCQVNSMK